MRTDEGFLCVPAISHGKSFADTGLYRDRVRSKGCRRYTYGARNQDDLPTRAVDTKQAHVLAKSYESPRIETSAEARLEGAFYALLRQARRYQMQKLCSSDDGTRLAWGCLVW